MNLKEKLIVVLCIIIFGLTMGFKEELHAVWQRGALAGFGGAALGAAMVMIMRRRRSAE